MNTAPPIRGLKTTQRRPAAAAGRPPSGEPATLAWSSGPRCEPFTADAAELVAMLARIAVTLGWRAVTAETSPRLLVLALERTA